MRATLLPMAHKAAVSINYNGQEVYCGLGTASEVILIFTTQLYSCLCNYNAKVFIS